MGRTACRSRRHCPLGPGRRGALVRRQSAGLRSGDGEIVLPRMVRERSLSRGGSRIAGRSWMTRGNRRIGAIVRRRRRELRDVLLDPGIEHDEHLVARHDDGVGLGHEARSSAKNGDHERPLGQADVGDRQPRRRRVVRDDQLDDLQPLLGQIEQVDEAVARHLVLDQTQDQVGRARPPAGCRAA